ncbi:isoprenoid biosynthesis glyoxalase ElbB [Chitinimonas koreensis]|uniref:isoprenoid biosynthesis glyoxalase ElbB n=1 Tax=Chitinimonas koreensis TaxID=356302 RepID=UPI00041DA9C5|nr:isoprenoid biosynthesis glyoxalase ElbB [Chitinimonas koreensis]QNM97918.1 isoprenoid biosynthesis glyoxalase ElbB [Chitinimonas koreensis]
MSKVAVVLSGCGFLDGAEITEAVSTLVCLSQAGIAYQCYAPDRNQMHVVDHARGAPTDEQRNVLAEAARIARGDIRPLTVLDEASYDAIVFPGGFGAAKNLTTFAQDGQAARMHDDVKAAVMPFVTAAKPVVTLCAAPLILALAAREIGLRGVRITLGAGGEPLAEAIAAWGQTHVPTPVDAACVDEERRFVSAPAYMYGEASPAEVFASVKAAIAALGGFLG